MVTVKVVGTTVVLSVDGKAVDILRTEQACKLASELRWAVAEITSEHVQEHSHGS